MYENRWAIALFVSLFFYTNDAYAVYDTLIETFRAIFAGLRKVIYPAATIGIACVCIGGMFGNFNWKWLVAILLGVFIIAFSGENSGVAEIAMDGSE